MSLTPVLVALTAAAAASDEFAGEARTLHDLLAAMAHTNEPVDDLAAHAVERARFFCARLCTRPGVDQARMGDLYRYLTEGAA